jgi:hypothetical protein
VGTVLAGDVDPGRQQVVAGRDSDGLDGDRALQPVAGHDRAVVGEALLAVHHARVVQPQCRVGHHLTGGALGDHDGEGRWRNDVLVAE